MNEDERAALHRDNLAARRRGRAANFASLAGNRQAREALDADWQPVRLARLEAELPALGDEALLEEMLVAVPRRNLYVTDAPGGLVA